MNSLTLLHRKAMDFADQAFLARLRGNVEQALALFKEAFELEREVALSLQNQYDAEPSRSILLRSAASLALDCGEHREAERLICLALSGSPPLEIAEELRDLLEQVNFSRHLDLKGITLAPDEFQLSIAGSGVGLGIVQTDEFVDRVNYFEKLVYRTAERKLNKPYRDSGRVTGEIKDRFGLYTSVPRAASFAVTFKLGTQPELLSDSTSASDIVDEIFTCLQLLNSQNDEELRKIIPDESYHRNFLGIAKRIAPDGKEISLIGLTAIRDGKIKKVEITRKSGDLPPIVTDSQLQPKVAKEEYIEISGRLRFADATSGESGKIRLIDSEQKSYTVIVPEGLMSDIVRPLWDYEVRVRGKVKGKRITLVDISKIS